MAHIPPILHYVWFGPRSVPREHQRFIEGWRRLMPDWRIMGWTDGDIDWSVRYLRQAYATRGWTRLADYMRVYALYRHGGFYLDTDIELLSPLDPLCDERVVLGFQTVERTPSWVNNAVIGAEPGHPFLARWLRAFEETMPGWRRMGDAHGPGLVTRLLEAEGLDGERATEPRRVGDVLLLPPEGFYPHHWTQTFSAEYVTPATFAVHHWGGAESGHRPLTFGQKIRAISAWAAPGLAAAAMRRRVGAERRARAFDHPLSSVRSRKM
jgi:hypothetical protein